jgi:clan AA aspartic protease
MMHGHVYGLQALIGIVFRLPDRSEVEIEFVIDTGFEGALTLPPAAVSALGLPFFQEMDANLANDSAIKTDVHIATILWRGREIEVAVLSLGRRPLLGTALLDGCHLGADFADNGLVAINALA